MPAAVAPASTATPTSTGQTALLRTLDATSPPGDVIAPAYGVYGAGPFSAVGSALSQTPTFVSGCPATRTALPRLRCRLIDR
jgi:hypothetical protein